jgi:hypothetical protein
MFVHRDLESQGKRDGIVEGGLGCKPVSEEVWMTKHFMNAGDVGK